MTWLEPRSETDPDQLTLVVGFLFDRIGQIEINRAERRFPGDADAWGNADRRRIPDRMTRDGRIVDAPGGAHIDKAVPAHAQFFRQAEREVHVERDRVVVVGAQRILRREIVRTDAADLEAAQIVAADEEPVFEPDALTDAADVTRFSGEAQDPVRKNRIVIAALNDGAEIAGVEAESGKIGRQLSEVPGCRCEAVVAAVEYQRLADGRRPALSFVLENVGRSGGQNVVDRVRPHRVTQRLTQIFVDLIAGAQDEAIRELVVLRELLIVVVHREKVEARRQIAVEEIGLREAQIGLLRQERDQRADAQILTGAEQVTLANADIGQRAFGGRVTDADGELAGRLLLDLHVKHRLVGRAARLVGDGDFLEEAEILDALLRAFQLAGIEGVAFDQPELAADHLVEGPNVAVDVDALDPDMRAFLDAERDIDRVLHRIAVNARRYVDERIAVIAERVGDVGDRFLNQIRVVPVAVMGGDRVTDLFLADVLEGAVERDLAEMIARPLVERVGDEESVLRRRQFRDRQDHAKLGVALAQIEFAQQLAVVRDAVGIVIVVGRQDPPPARFLGLQDAAQLAGAEMGVADEIDAAHFGDGPFVDLEHQIDAVLRQADDLGIDRGGEAAAAAIQLDDAPHVALHLGAGEDLARLFLNFLIQRVVGQFAIALEHHAVDDRILHHLYHERVALAAQPHVSEEAGVEKGLERAVDAVGVERIARLHRHVGFDGFGFDAFGALDADFGDRAAGGDFGAAQRRQQNRDGRGSGDCGAHRNDCPSKSQYNPPPSIWTVCAFYRFGSGHQPLDERDDMQSRKIVPRRKHHQGKHQRETQTDAVFLRPVAQRFSSYRFRDIKQQVSPVKNGDRKQIDQAEIDREHGHEPDQRDYAAGRDLARHANDADRAAQLLARAAAGHHLP